MQVCETMPDPTPTRDLRRQPTGAERRLFHALGHDLPAARFRRQVPVTPYYAGFMSFAHRLIVELDGEQPVRSMADTARRTAFLERKGYRLLRFPEADVTRNLSGMVDAIAVHCTPAQRASGSARGPAAGPGVRRR